MYGTNPANNSNLVGMALMPLFLATKLGIDRYSLKRLDDCSTEPRPHHHTRERSIGKDQLLF